MILHDDCFAHLDPTELTSLVLQPARSNPEEARVLAQMLGSIGLVRLLEQIATWQRVLVVLTYHRIATPGHPSNLFYDPVISATPEAFEDQLRFLAKRFHIIGPDVLLDIASKIDGNIGVFPETGKPLAFITFDDGYRDNFDTALPILRKLAVPATFFIPTRFLTAACLPWWDHVAFVLKQTNVPELTLKRCIGDADPIFIDLGLSSDARSRTVAIMTVIRLFLQDMIDDERWFLTQLDEQAEVSVDTVALGRDLFMSLDQVRQLCDSGMSVGSHCHSHRMLAGLDDSTQLYEVAESKRFLENALGREIQMLAYPFGWSKTFTARTVQLAIDAGYRLAFSSVEGVNRIGSPALQLFALHRLNVGLGDSSSLLRARVVSYAAFGKSLL